MRCSSCGRRALQVVPCPTACIAVQLNCTVTLPLAAYLPRPSPALFSLFFAIFCRVFPRQLWSRRNAARRSSRCVLVAGVGVGGGLVVGASAAACLTLRCSCARYARIMRSTWFWCPVATCACAVFAQVSSGSRACDLSVYQCVCVCVAVSSRAGF